MLLGVSSEFFRHVIFFYKIISNKINYDNMNISNMNFMNRTNPMLQQNNQGNQNESFRNVFGILGKINNLLIGGLQSLLHIFTSLIDILYFAKAFKSLIIDLLFALMKKIFRILRYLLTFKWFVKLIQVLNSKYASVIYQSKNFKFYSICIKFFLASGKDK